MTPPDSGYSIDIRGMYVAGPMDLRDDVETMSLDGRSGGVPLRGLSGRQLREVGYFGVWPNLLISPHPDYVLTHRIEPLDVDRTFIECEWLFPPEALERPGFDPGYAVEFWDITNREDWNACESLQRGVSSRGHRPGPLSVAWEAGTYMFVTMLATGYLEGEVPRAAATVGLGDPALGDAGDRAGSQRCLTRSRSTAPPTTTTAAGPPIPSRSPRRWTCSSASSAGGTGSWRSVSGTGALALPLAGRGVPIVGLDLSLPMMDKLAEKAGGRAPFPLVRGDATRLPVRTDSLGGAYCRWVLHLIPNWRDAVAELTRVVRPGGVIVTEPGGFGGGWRDLWLRFVDVLGDRIRPVGLDWVGQYEDLDAAFAAGGAVRRDLEPVLTRNDSTLSRYFAEVEERLYSWTWRVPPEELAPAVAEVKAWAERSYPDHDAPFEPEAPIIWRAYDVGLS